LSIENCKIVLDFDENLIIRNEKIINKELFNNYKTKCLNKYDISNLEINLENCKKIIALNKDDLKSKYILVDFYNKKRNKCIEQFLKVKFST
jgi:hypothetical protein